MWYPNKLQWLVIWLSTVICLILWLAGDPEPKGFLGPSLLVAALFIWQVSQGEKTSGE